MNFFRRARSTSRRSSQASENHQSFSSSNLTLVSDESAARICVTLPNSMSVLIPVDIDSTISELHLKAVQRATQLDRGVLYRTDTTNLHIGGPNGPILWGEDQLIDAIDVNQNEAVWLVHNSGEKTSLSLEDNVDRITPLPPIGDVGPATLLRFTSEKDERKGIYIRWITADRVIADHSRIQSIPVDKDPVSPSLTICDLRNTAFSRLFSTKVAIGEVRKDTQVQLFTSQCYLSSKASAATTIDTLGFEGTLENPLDIFVVPTRPESSKLQNNWSFSCSERGIAAFITCLKLFLKNIDKQGNSIDNVLEVLWELTHFPPAVIAFRDLYDNGVRPLSCAVFASCFREACAQMVPPWISSRRESLLEASRQIFYWLHSIRSESSKKFEKSHTIVHQVAFSESNGDGSGIYGYNEVVSVPSSSTGDKWKKILVSKVSKDSIPYEFLALALDGSYEYPCNYYFNLPVDFTDLRVHKRGSLLHPSDFDNLLETANNDDIFKIVGPLGLSQCPGTTLPVITLDEKGFVSLYDQKDVDCGDRHYFTSNEVNAEKKMPATEPGQFLLQKLHPIILERKKEGTWETDAWSEESKKVEDRPPEEAIVICVDRSSSMGSQMYGWNGESSSTGISRLSEVKDVFKNMVTRINAYKLDVHLGLVTFATQGDVRINQALTPLAYDFRDKLEFINASGSTAMWDAILKAKTMLAVYKKKFPKARLRIVALTDGEDNNSKVKAPAVVGELYRSDIVLDAIVIGTHLTYDLFKVAKHTGGYGFVPKSRMALYQIFLLETFLDIRTRPDIVRIQPTNFANSLTKPADMQDIYDFPPCRPHENQNDHFIALADAGRFLGAMSNRANRNKSSVASSRSSISGWSLAGSTITGNSSGGASGVSRLLHNEIKAMIDNPHPYMDVYVSERNMGFWKVAMQGPPSSPYEKGTFLLYVEMGGEFPRKPPSARFITPVLHPNISKHGRICHPIFDREWNPNIRISEVLEHIWSILMHLEARDAIDPLSTLKFFTDPEAGRVEVEKYVDRFARTSRELLKFEITSSTSSAPSLVSRPPSVLSLNSSMGSSIAGSRRDNTPPGSTSSAGLLSRIGRRSSLFGSIASSRSSLRNDSDSVRENGSVDDKVNPAS